MKIKDLAKPFPKESVHWRIQGQPYESNGQFRGKALAYLDARDVMDRLDEVCGPENWQDSYVETASGRVICSISIRIGDSWVSKSDGAGGTAVEAEKGGLSDAMKRAAVKWGIGRYLYRLDAPWVRCEMGQKNGKTSFKKWAEDPWSKVKNAPIQREEQTATSGETEAAINAIFACQSLDDLKEYWTKLYNGQRHVADDPAVTGAKNERKTELEAKAG